MNRLKIRAMNDNQKLVLRLKYLAILTDIYLSLHEFQGVIACHETKSLIKKLRSVSKKMHRLYQEMELIEYGNNFLYRMSDGELEYKFGIVSDESCFIDSLDFNRRQKEKGDD